VSFVLFQRIQYTLMYTQDIVLRSKPNAFVSFANPNMKKREFHCKKGLEVFPVTSRDVTNKLSVAGNN
jgi:hypothetical protein